MATFPHVIRDGKKRQWQFDNYGEIDPGTQDTFDYAGDSSSYIYQSTPTLTMGGRQLVYGPYTSSEISHTRKIYVSKQAGFVRYLEIFTNEGTSATTKSVTFTSSMDSFAANAVRTSDGNSSFSTGDNWIVWDDTADANLPTIHVVSGKNAQVPPSQVTQEYSNVSYAFDLSLQPGETKVVMHFIALDAKLAGAQKLAKSLAALKGDALRGINDFELDHIVNFVPNEEVKLAYNGSKKADVLVGDRYDETFDGLGGNDIIQADSGNDRIAGGDGNDILMGDDGNDVIRGGMGKDVVDGGNGDDEIYGDNGGNLVTTTASKKVKSTGEQLSISLTLPDAATGSELPVTGFVSRTPVTSNKFNIAFVIDVSGSTSGTFSGDVTVGDVNGDGVSNTILDAEIAGFQALLRGITKQVGAENVNVAVIPFESSSWTAYSGSAARDADGDGATDVVESLKSLDDLGGTDFEEGLQQTVDFFNGTSTNDGQNLVFFLSDGGNNEGGPITDEVSTLMQKNGIAATIKSFGVGSNAIEADLDLVDDTRSNDSVQIVLDPADLSKVLIDPGIKKTDVKAVKLLVNGKLAMTIPGKQLKETPLGLNFSFETVLKGLKLNADDKVVAKVIGADKHNTTVATSQIVEDLKASDGADVLMAGKGNDYVKGGDGGDKIYGGAGADILQGEDGNDRIVGGRDSDLLDGGAGNDVLNGGFGSDQMVGGAGNDRYVVDRKSDKVVETRNNGNDTVQSSIDYKLAGHIEKLVLTGNAKSGIGNGADNVITGNAGANKLVGNAGDDVIKGGAGNDRLEGGTGRDKMTGGAGKDTFVFNKSQLVAKDNLDQITDFKPGQDRIALDNSIFSKVGGNGKLAPSAFHKGKAAADKNDRVIYDPGKGALYYDSDGKGGGSAIQIAELSKNLNLKASDFFIL